MTNDIKQIIDKSNSFKTNKEIALAKEFINLSSLLEGVIKAIGEAKTVSVENLGEVKIDLSPLEVQLGGVKDSISAVIPAIKGIPQLDLSGIEKLLTKISNKKEREIDLSELDNISRLLVGVSDAIKAIPTPKDPEQTVPELTRIQELLTAINENLVSIELPEFKFDYERLENALAKVGGGGGPNHVTLQSGGSDVSSANPLPVTMSSDLQIGAVELKNATSDDRVAVINSAPTTEFGVVTRNIPSGTQQVSGDLDLNAPAGEYEYGATTGLAISASANLVSYTALAGDKLRGFSATSDRYARYRLKVNGTTVLSGRSGLGADVCVNYTPIAVALTVGDAVILEVTNESTQGTSSAEGSLILEN